MKHLLSIVNASQLYDPVGFIVYIKIAPPCYHPTAQHKSSFHHHARHPAKNLKIVFEALCILVSDVSIFYC